MDEIPFRLNEIAKELSEIAHNSAIAEGESILDMEAGKNYEAAVSAAAMLRVIEERLMEISGQVIEIAERLS